MKFHTTAFYVSGAICGDLWWPAGELAGMPHSFDVRTRRARFSDPTGTTFRDVLLSELTERGGDFQGALFSEDTVLRIERRSEGKNGRYSVHVRERPIAELPGCADLIRPNTYSSDFFGED